MRKYLVLFASLFFCLCINSQPNYDLTKLQQEKLGRGVVAMRNNATEVVLSWRYLTDDPIDVAFNIYRDGKKIAEVPEHSSTYFVDEYAGQKQTKYKVVPVINGAESKDLCQGSYTLPANAPEGYIELPLEQPAAGVTPAGEEYTYISNDASVGDVDGDGEYEIFLKWEPTNSKDNAHDGYTGNTYFDCYKLNGERLWRIDMGHNIRSGPHYTQFMVYDFDGDGRAEMITKTADGTVDSKGTVIGDANADYREVGVPREGVAVPGWQGRIMKGKEYLTVFDGLTGEALKTVDFSPERGEVEDWGDNYANRSDRFLACVAYLDGQHPSMVMCRGYYLRTAMTAFDWDGKELTQRWTFDTKAQGLSDYEGQGNHNIATGDVDGDGCDEIVYGGCVIDHNGQGLYTTKLGHGDAMHLTQVSLDLPGLQVWDCHENKRDGMSLRDAGTGKIIFQIKDNADIGRCLAADIDPTNPGLELWSKSTLSWIYNAKGKSINIKPNDMPINFAIWWDGDLLRELLNKNVIQKYLWRVSKCSVLKTFDGCIANNGSKSTPTFQGDILGDWREEVIMRTEDNSALRIYVTPHTTEYRFHTFLQDPIYRLCLANQNVAYNQPPQPGFYFGPDLGGGIFRGWDFR